MNNLQLEKLNKAREFALQKGGECLSTEYINNQSKMTWKCSNPNHRCWVSSFTNAVNNNRWCVECGRESQIKKRKNKNGLEQAELYAQSKGGQCLSTEYINTDTKMIWKCSDPNHKPWGANFYSTVRNGSWCSECGIISKVKKGGLEQAETYANSKGGQCLSTEYINIRTKMTWKCLDQNHQAWEADFNSVVNFNHWCPECGNKSKAIKNGLEQAEAYAQSKGGQCLSKQYVNNCSKMTWKCSDQNHQPWESNFTYVVKDNHWCPECLKSKNKQDGFEQAKAHAQSKGGQCLSTIYEDANAKMLWKCAKKEHKPWTAKYSNVVNNGHWCPECGKRNLSEQRTRLIFEEFFGNDFPSIKPTWNVNPWTYRNLELDGYCEALKVAFEYDGQHHYGLVSYGGNRKKQYELTYQKFKDHQKKKNCLNQGITLVNIPFIDKATRSGFKPFLENVVLACKDRGFDMEFTSDQLNDLEKRFYAV